MNLLFVDSVCYKPYTCNTMRSEALGGSEATLLRIARGLAQAGFDVSVYQHVDDARNTETVDGIRHIGLESSFPNPNVVVHLRTAKELPVWRGLYPKARHLVWMQDLADLRLKDEPLAGTEIIYNSHFEKAQYQPFLAEHGIIPGTEHVLFNPVEVDGMRYPKVEGRLGFFSSPHKGLDEVVRKFQAVRKPGMELVYANPGYVPDGSAEGCTNLGQLSHPRVMEEMSKCEVLFYPQTVFPETFGIVLAEANAMGTPVLAHDFGAASEVLAQPGNEVVDCTLVSNVEAALERILAAKPKVGLKPEYALSAVVDSWKAMLEAQ